MNSEAEKVVRKKLEAYSDLKCKDFNVRIIATVPSERVMGVKTPQQRMVAKEVFKSEYKDSFLENLPHDTYEENQVHGFLIEQEKDRDKVISLLNEFLPYVDNWATCDSVSPKVFKKNPPDIDLIHQWMGSEHVYTCRYGIGMLMRYYLDERFSEEYLDDVAEIQSDEYYINMMRAWFFATALAKQYQRTLPYIENKRLDKWTHNKTIQKAKESYRVSEDHKKQLERLICKKGSLSVRKATENDANAVLSLYHNVSAMDTCTWNEEYPGTIEIKNDIRNGNLFLLMSGSDIAGVLSIVHENELDELPCWTPVENCREIARIAVSPSFQGKNLSTCLIDYSIGLLRSQGCEAIHLLVAEKNLPAQKIYCNCGFKIVGKYEMYGNKYFAGEKLL